MSKYRKNLPELGGMLFLTDGGMETILIFDEGRELPLFAAFTLGQTFEGRAWLNAYSERYLDISEAAGAGFVLGSATWRASRDWAEQLGLDATQLADIQRTLVADLLTLRAKRETPGMPIVVSGCVGPRGDGYDAGAAMTADAAENYHREQIATLAEAGVDVITAMTLTNIPEAIGIARAAKAAGVPVVLSFTVETNGRLPAGDKLAGAIDDVDYATDSTPEYYMINCAHPNHFADALRQEGSWINRLRGIRANASTKSHAELDCCETLDNGDPIALGKEFAELVAQHDQISVLGGCCGTDHRHIEQIAMTCRASAVAR